MPWREWIFPANFEAEYARSLLAQYDAKSIEASKIRSRIEQLRDATAKDAASACELDLLLLREQSLDELRLGLPVLTKRYVDVTGDTPPPSLPDSTTEVEALRALAVYLTGQIHRAYGLNRRFELTRQSLVLQMSLAAILVLAGAGWFKYWRQSSITVIDLAMFAGTVGGFTSCLRRVYTMPRTVDVVSAMQSLTASRSSMIVAPLLGCVFGLTMHLVTIGGLVKGMLFPNLSLQSNTPEQVMLFKDFFYGTVQGAGPEFAKLTIWAFIAGFAERFFPDVIDSFTAKARLDKS